ncbi:MAG: S8 family serine peptidase [Planctomycetota bacterium]
MSLSRCSSTKGYFGLRCSENCKLTEAVFTLLVFLLVTTTLAPAAIHHVPGQGAPHPIPEEEEPAVFIGWDPNRDNVECYTLTRPGVDYVPNEIIVKFKRQVADAVEGQLKLKTPPGQLKLSNGLDKLNARHRVRKIRPVFKNFKKNHQWLKGLPQKSKALLSKKEKHILNRLARAPKGAMVPELDRIYKIELENGQSLQEVVAAYNNDPDVEYAELNYIVYLDTTPNDPYPVGPSSYRSGTPDCDIDAPEAWDVNTGSSDIVIAVIDTGVEYTHRDLQANMWVNSGEIPDNGVDDDDNGYVDDVYGYDLVNEDGDPIDDIGHGTHCAGIIAAMGDNGFDVAGVCWDAKIMSVKIFSESGQGCGCDIYQAFYYAVNNGADITSNSWGGGGYSQTHQQIIDYVHSQGVLTVASAGNQNSSGPHYPSAYANVIGVAATDSDDKKASFSNYGDRVDIAAPGVDVLSLRAAGTSLGTVYDDYTTILSGTSMACPHVSGVAALIMSRFPGLSLEDIEMRLLAAVDDITEKNPDYKWLLGTGRLNAHKALKALLDSFDGVIVLDAGFYSCDSIVTIKLSDLDIVRAGTQQVTLTTDGGDQETVTLAEETDRPWIFAGTIQLSADSVSVEDGTLQVSDGDIITATYNDANDSSGNPAIMQDTAGIDCEPPVISNVQLDSVDVEPTVTFETDEPTTARVLCSLACGGEYIIEAVDSTLTTTHAIKIRGVYPETTYFCIVEAADVLEHTTIDDNAGQCYSFTTAPAPPPVYVPADYNTIQEAVDAAGPGGTIIVADGTYRGEGNRDIDLLGKVVTVRSENGPNNCIIDCNGTETDQHRGFYFHNDEGPGSVVEGFTITNGYIEYPYGGTIYCQYSSPTITNCKFIGNSMGYGGGIYCYKGGPRVSNCTFSGNWADWGGGGMEVYKSPNPPIITSCTFIGNSTERGGGGLLISKSSNPIVTNCTFTDNSVRWTMPGGSGSGGGMRIYESNNSTISNCTFIGNSAFGGGGLINVRSSSTITDCVFTGNSSHGSHSGCQTYGQGGGMNCNTDCDGTTITNCVFTDNTADLVAGLHNWSSITVTDCTFNGNAALFGDVGGMCNHHTLTMTNCTFSGNSSVQCGGGFDNWTNDRSFADATLINCKFIGNSTRGPGGCFGTHGGGMDNYMGAATLTNCVFQGNSSVNYGGGMSNADAATTLTNCTFVANSATNGGNALDCFTLSPSLIGLANCILWDGSNEIHNSNGSRIFVVYSDICGSWPGIGNINVDPCLVADDYHLLETSPCINAGNPDYPDDPNETDIDGQPRVFDGRIDMGADEFVPPVEVSMKLTPRALNVGSKGNWIKAHFVMPQVFEVNDIDANTPATLEPLGITSDYINVFINESGFVEVKAAFERSAFCDSGVSDEVIEVTGTGLLTSGQPFCGTDTIRIIKNNFQYLALLASHWLETGCGQPDWCNGLDVDQNSTVDFVDFAMFDGCCIQIITE